MKKPESEIKKTQRPATGSETAARDGGHSVDAEVAAMGITPKVVPGHGQGGSGS